MRIHNVETDMRARKTKTEVRQEQIAQAALGIVERHGLRGLNVARVAKAVGVVPSCLYRHYPGKDGVLDTVLDLIAARMEANVAQARANGASALDRLHGLLTRHVEMIRRNSAIPRVVFSEELLHGRPAQRRRMYEIIRGYLRQVEQIIRDGQREGCIRAAVDPEAASVLFLGLIQPGVVLWAMSDGEFDITAHAEAGWKLFVKSVG
jgi:AcrR family transcriptional regulator